MNIAFTKKLSTRLFTPLIVIFTIVLIILASYVPNITKQNAIDTATASAESTVSQFKAIRGYYTKNVIKKVLAGSDLKGHYHHANDPGKIPLPATFIHDISEELSSKDILTLKLYSPYPFPNRSQRKLDGFGKEAWDTLKKNPGQTFTTLDEINGKQVVRVAMADTMSQPGCVACHNSHPQTPKNDWKLDEVRGVLEVQVPVDDAIASASSLNRTIALIVVLSLAATVALLVFMFRQLITHRLFKVRGALDDIANGDGDLSQRLDEEPRDEIGAIATAFNHFMEQLEKSLQHISVEVKQLLQTSTDMASITEATQQQMEAQQQETDQVASAMNEMTSTSQEMANMATNTAEQSQSTQQQSDHGREIVAANMQSVQTLSDTMSRAAEAVTTLEADSQNIGGVLDVIRGIAEQTNLLALNAAIEAARAGEQGRGFAVVADEVRTLASRTQESTEEIHSMIEQLQSGAKNAVQTISQGRSNIDASLEHANETNEMIDNIAEAINQIQNLNLQIATAAEEQTSVSEEINHNITNIAGSSSTTNENGHKILQVAENINTAVQNINKQLQRFTH
jgi:methyl-accepting chemotaxis protein